MLRFIHITKTGGMSVQRTIGTKNPRCLMADHKPFLKADLNRTTFAVVRDPYDRVKSLYNFYKYKRNVVKEDTFRDFVLNLDFYYAGKNIGHQYNTFWSCYDYLSLDGELKVNHVLRFENIAEEYHNFALKHKLPLELIHINKNDKKEDGLKWDMEMIDVVQRLYDNDFKYFNYEK